MSTDATPRTAEFDVARTRAALPRLVDAPAKPAAALHGYLSHYGIDFADDGHAHYLGTFDSTGERLVGHIVVPPDARGTALVVHGYFDHVGLYGHLVRYCLARRLAVVALDLPGHGLSAGPPATIDSFGRYVAAVEELRALVVGRVPEPWHLFGQSMGGAIAMAMLQGRGYRAANVPYRNIVLLAPLVRPYGWARLRIVYFLLRRFLRQWPRTFVGNTHEESFTRFLREDDPLQARTVVVQWITAMVRAMEKFLASPATDVPVLIVQGDDDGTVDARFNTTQISDKFAADVVWLDGGRHHLVNESEDLRREMFGSIDLRWRD